MADGGNKKPSERVAIERKPEIVLVVGDLNSTFAAALVAGELGI